MGGSLVTFPTRPFLDGTVKTLMIGGQWVDAAAGRAFGSLNPATGQVLAHRRRAGGMDMEG